MSNEKPGWCYWHPAYVEKLQGWLTPNVVWTREYGEMSGIDSAPLFQKGHIWDLRLVGGKVLPTVSIESLVCAGETDLLRVLMGPGEDDCEAAETDALRLVVHGNDALARDRLNDRLRADPTMRDILMLGCLYGDVDRAVGFVPEWSWTQCDWQAATRAVRLFLALGRNDLAEEAAMGLSPSERAVLLCYSMDREHTLFGCGDLDNKTGRDHAATLLREAEESAGLTSQQLVVAKGYLRLLNGTGRARAAVRKGQEHAKCHRAWGHVAAFHRQYFGNTKAGRRCLRRAEETARRPDDYLYCSDVWLEFFGDLRRARSCLRKTEWPGMHHDFRLYVAREWRDAIGDLSSARRLIRRAERTAVTTDGWVSCARLWASFEPDTKDVERCLYRAKRAARTVWEGISCSRAFGEFPCTPVDDVQSNEEVSLWHANDLASDAQDWIVLARAWVSHSNGWNAKYCLTEADRAAANEDDFARCAEAFAGTPATLLANTGVPEDMRGMERVMPRTAERLSQLKTKHGPRGAQAKQSAPGCETVPATDDGVRCAAAAN